MRTPIIAGNWKMNKTIDEALALAKEIHYGLPTAPNAEIIVAPIFTALNKVSEFLKDSFIGVAAQNIFWEDTGAYTGKISGLFAKDAGADYAIIGHSERRQYFNETDETVNKKIKSAFKHQLIPILCVGETLAQREANQMQSIVHQQVTQGLVDFTAIDIDKLIIAYEPVWAFGTGKTATPEQAEEAHVIIRNIIAEQFGNELAEKMRILYGGRVKPSNSKELLSLKNIDGALIGGASLKANDFIDIINTVV